MALQELAQNIFFTNFFVTKLGFWSEPHVLEFLGEVDGSGMAYKHRGGTPHSTTPCWGSSRTRAPSWTCAMWTTSTGALAT